MSIPADIFIVAQHIEIVRNGILNADPDAASLNVLVILKGGGDQTRRIRGVGILNELPQEAVPRIIDGSLIGYGVDDERSAIVVSRNHLLQLIFGVVQS